MDQMKISFFIPLDYDVSESTTDFSNFSVGFRRITDNAVSVWSIINIDECISRNIEVTEFDPFDQLFLDVFECRESLFCPFDFCGSFSLHNSRRMPVACENAATYLES